MWSTNSHIRSVFMKHRCGAKLMNSEYICINISTSFSLEEKKKLTKNDLERFQVWKW